MTRRQFLKLLSTLALVGFKPLRSAAETLLPTVTGGGVFVWQNLKTGQVVLSPSDGKPAKGLPGSLMKLVAVTALLEDNRMPITQQFDCAGHITLNGQTYHCQHPHGRLTLVQAIGVSCNVYFAQACHFLTTDLFFTTAKQFGFIPPAAATHSVQSYALGLALDFEVTQLQLLNMATLVALRGTVLKTHLAGATPLVLKPTTWTVLQQGMRLAVTNGTAVKLDPTNVYKAAAKTGTAPHGRHFQSWVIGYFPSDAPRYAFCYRAPAGTGADTAVPGAHTYLTQHTWPGI